MIINDIKLPVATDSLWNIHNAMLAHQISLLPPNNIQALYSNLATSLPQAQTIALNNFQINNSYQKMFLCALAASNELLTSSTIAASLSRGAILTHPESWSNYSGSLPFLNNHFAWIGAMENFQQAVSNRALMTDVVADKFALDITTEEILPLFKKLDEKVVADIVSNKDDIDIPEQQRKLIKKLLSYKATITHVIGLIKTPQEENSFIWVLLSVLIFTLDYFDKKLNTK